MITIYKNTENGLTQLSEPVSGAWLHVIDPTTDEIETLMSFGVPQEFVTYPLDLDERPRTEREDDGKVLIVLRIPYYQGAKFDVPYISIPLGIILVDNLIITVCRWQNDVMQDFASGRMRGFSTSKRNRFILRILLATANKYLAYLREINKITEALEDRLQLSMQNKEVLELLKYQKSLVYFTTALRSNELMMERLQKGQMFRLYPDDEDLLEDVLTENQQAIEMVNISGNILSSMMDAFASIISNNLNIVMKFLTSVTIVLSIPTIVTSFFGMNVGLPFADLDHAYLIVIGMFTMIALLVIFIFVRRKWF
ncbi:MAG TPA: magnesium transporter CorA family protein [Anaerolineaceae bacterium]|nr:magnesium transporter CorA family protein [Anaerolineaceae bacterium]